MYTFVTSEDLAVECISGKRETSSAFSNKI